MEIVFEIIFRLIAEIVLQLVFEVLVELGVRSVKETFEKPPNPWLASIGYAILGAISGGVSVLLLPSPFLDTPTTRVVNLLLTPIAAGAAMAALGAWRRRKDQPLIRIDRFSYGYLFALAMAVVRYVAID